jgi:hypothetical protein
MARRPLLSILTDESPVRAVSLAGPADRARDARPVAVSNPAGGLVVLPYGYPPSPAWDFADKRVLSPGYEAITARIQVRASIAVFAVQTGAVHPTARPEEL